MFPAAHGVVPAATCFPRIRGDVPASPESANHQPTFSPHTRGCSVPPVLELFCRCVFPAYAGMFRSTRVGAFLSMCFPRIRGDVPPHGPLSGVGRAFSPHTRGCSFLTYSNSLVTTVFPAYAGMFRQSALPYDSSMSFPRIRGDVPTYVAIVPGMDLFSPHTRGCSAQP